MSKKTLLISLVVYICAALTSYGVLSFLQPQITTPGTNVNSGQQGSTDPEQEETALGQLLDIDPNEPKDQPCPLNGKLFTATEKAAWEQRRPLAVMIENTPDSRPQSGMSDADVVFEAVAEYGITRYMGVFYCQSQVADVTLAPVRSARTYFIDWASGFNYPMYVHVGGANTPGPSDALGQLREYGWDQQNDMNQFSIGYPTFIRNANRLGREVATEHTMETSTEKLWAVATKRNWTNMSPDRRVAGKVVPGTDWKDGYSGWTFESSARPGSSVQSIEYEFWSGLADYAVKWEYNPATDSYDRFLAGEKHTDLNDETQLSYTNVIVLFTDEEGPINELRHMLYRTEGTGKALLFKHGEVEEIIWSKDSRESELEFLDKKGQPVELAQGQIWISVLDRSADVRY